MKKLIAAFLALCMLTGCSTGNVEKNTDEDLSENVQVENS